jgi:murein tripeptide amidase MpaA
MDARDAVRLAIRKDTRADFRQWFHFRVDGAKGPLKMTLENASEATYADAFEGYRVCASYDGERWFRVPTSFDGERVVVEHEPEEDRIFYGYFAPYTYERHQSLIANAKSRPGVRHEVVGQSIEGRDLDLLVISGLGDGDDDIDGKLKIWVQARQHPGETMAEWYMEGLVGRLLDLDDEIVRTLRSRAAFFLIPNMNPDGSVLGNLRTNAVGFNLNRAWEEPSLEESPEVYWVRQAMERVGVDMFLDVHGDERNPYCFLAGCEGNPSYSERLRFLENLFEQSLLEANEDFQDEYGYDRDEPGGGDLRTAGNWVGERFDCLSFTVEMPFKDNANHPDPWVGWSPERSMHLGGSTLDSVLVCLDSLRGEITLPEPSEGDDASEGDEEGDEENGEGGEGGESLGDSEDEAS